MGNVDGLMFLISWCIFASGVFTLVIGINCFILPLYITIGTKLWGLLFKWELIYGTLISKGEYVDVNNKLKPNYTVKYNYGGTDYSVRLNKVGSKKNIGDRVKLIYFKKPNTIKSGEVGKLNWILGSIITIIGLIVLIIGIFSLITYWIPIS